MFSIKQLATLNQTVLNALTNVLLDCVDSNASVSFMHPLPRAKANAFWESVAADVEVAKRILLVTQNEHGQIGGTAQVVLAQPDKQPHRADIAKMLVHRNGRRQGMAQALRNAAEIAAAKARKTMLVLDSVIGGDAERLYVKLGW